MMSKRFRTFAARFVFIIGLFLVILGISYLLGYPDRASKISFFFAFLLVVAGVCCAIFAVRLSRRASYLFFASFFLMSGLFLFLSALGIIPLLFSQSWPLLSVFSGLALLPVGWRRTGGFSPRYFVSSSAFITLGSALLVFSLDMVPFSFRQFVQDWWPLLIVLCGLTLVLISLGGRGSPPENEKLSLGFVSDEISDETPDDNDDDDDSDGAPELKE